jgi:hypothetical protein
MYAIAIDDQLLFIVDTSRENERLACKYLGSRNDGKEPSGRREGQVNIPMPY